MLTAGLGWEDFDARLAQEADFLSGLICILRVGCKRENFDLDACFLMFAQEFQKICDLFAAQCGAGNQDFPLRGLQIAFIDWCVGLRVENSASLLLLRSLQVCTDLEADLALGAQALMVHAFQRRHVRVDIVKNDHILFAVVVAVQTARVLFDIPLP